MSAAAILRVLSRNRTGEAVAPYVPAWTPASLPDLELWLSNGSLAAIGDAQPIAQWDDESGNDRHAVQATSTNRPTVRLTSGIYEVKGDGVDDSLVSTFGATVVQPTTAWFAGSVAAVNAIAMDSIDGVNRHAVYRHATAGTFNAYAGAELAGAADDAILHSFVIVFNGASSSVRVDGSATNGDAGAHSVAGLTLFAEYNLLGRFNAGVLRDVGLCSSVLAGDDLTNLETYLAGLI